MLDLSRVEYCKHRMRLGTQNVTRNRTSRAAAILNLSQQEHFMKLTQRLARLGQTRSPATKLLVASDNAEAERLRSTNTNSLIVITGVPRANPDNLDNTTARLGAAEATTGDHPRSMVAGRSHVTGPALALPGRSQE